MSGDKDKIDDDVELDSSDDSLTATVVMSDDDGDIAVGDSTVDMDIDKLVAKLEASDEDDVHRRAEIRHKLEDLREQRQQELDSTFNFNLNDDV